LKQRKVKNTQLVKPTTLERYIHALGYRISEKATKMLALVFTERVKLETQQILQQAYQFTEHAKRKTVKVVDLKRGLTEQKE